MPKSAGAYCPQPGGSFWDLLPDWCWLTADIGSVNFSSVKTVLVRPISLDMVEVGGSNTPGPTKIKNPPLGGFFGFGGMGLDESHCSTNATKGAFGPPQQSEGARRVQSPEAMAIEDIPPGPTK